MAAPDHTALARPPNPPGGKSTRTLGRPRRSADTVENSWQQVALKLTSIQEAMNEIAALVVESEVARKAHARGSAMRPGQWPLAQGCAENLVAAIRLLGQYAELLRREP
ncbi:hypothetical protein ISN76_00320 [Dyella halodurans]|uniref:Uncharacterized protein n=1 Tax=Dyella halodurans TaxID=1920171 RepID=A0ABV9BY53_9GAMM|nr:hypothetical protein [Dyella halodurans]